MNGITERHSEIIKMAEERFGKLPYCIVKFSSRAKRYVGQYTYYPRDKIHCITYSIYHIQNRYENVLNNTIPHEIAHFVCRIHNLGNNHDEGWKFVCRELGGNGQRCSNRLEVPRAISIAEQEKKDKK